jgi:bacillithiol system protein YtxJ
VWLTLESIPQLTELSCEESNHYPVVIFKHSTRCSVSMWVKKHLQSSLELNKEKFSFYYLDLIAHRDVSDKIAKLFNVQHESPQILIIIDGKCVYHASHSNISSEKITEIIYN